MLGKDEILQDRYRIVRKLGHGGMGAVYEAIDERFGEPIALKEITVDLVNEAHRTTVTKAFEREAKALAKAKHEVVPYVRDYFYERDRQFLVMELVDGDDLAEMLEMQRKPFPLGDVLKWIDQLLDALDYLHNLQPPIIHRDIKPQNLKLNDRRKIKLLDFGIARSGDKTSTVTNQTFVAATLNYSPIEQILRVIDPTFREFIILMHKTKAEKVLNQDTDVRCDIYSLGGTIYHLLTNRVPIDATKRTLEIWDGRPDPLTNPSELNPEIPSAVSAWLLKAMEIDRDNRFSSAIEMHKVLNLAIAKEKLESKAPAKNPILNKPDVKIESPAAEPKLTRARTERLITADEMEPEPTVEFIPETQPFLPVEVPVAPLIGAQDFNNEPLISDSSFEQVSEPETFMDFSQSDLSVQPNFDTIVEKIRKKRIYSKELVAGEPWTVNEETRIRNALHDLLRAVSWVSVLSIIFFVVLEMSFPRALGSAIGAVIIPAAVSLVFKNKARAFLFAWLIFMVLVLTGRYGT